MKTTMYIVYGITCYCLHFLRITATTINNTMYFYYHEKKMLLDKNQTWLGNHASNNSRCT